MRRLSLIGSFIAIAVALAACDSKTSGETATDSLPIIRIGDVDLFMELALTKEEQRKGLMFRDGIAPDHGMLFVFSQPQSMSFWMKNVDFPIDIGYLTADGVLREHYPMYANDTQSRRSIRDDLTFVLEVEHGFFKKHGIRAGAQLDLEAVNQAIAAKRSQR